MYHDPSRNRGILHDQPRPSYVYFVQGEYGGPIKIGVAVNPEVRRNEIQTGNPFVLVIRKTMIGSYPLESELHKRFAPDRMVGEWFQPSRELCDLANAKFGAPLSLDEVAAIKRKSYLLGRAEGIKRGEEAAINYWDQHFKNKPLLRALHEAA